MIIILRRPAARSKKKALFPILVDNILRTQVVEGVTLLSFFAKLSFLRKKNPSETSSTGVLQSFFQKRRSSRDSEAARQSAFFAKLSFLQKKAGASYLAAAFTGVQFA